MSNHKTVLGAFGSALLVVLTLPHIPWWFQHLFPENARNRDSGTSQTNPDNPTKEHIFPGTGSSPTNTHISVAYEGDGNGCYLHINRISVANRFLSNQEYYAGRLYPISNIELIGQQTYQYQIMGQVHCPPNNVPCEVFGEGNVNIVPDGIYYLSYLYRRGDQCIFKLEKRGLSVG